MTQLISINQFKITSRPVICKLCIQAHGQEEIYLKGIQIEAIDSEIIRPDIDFKLLTKEEAEISKDQIEAEVIAGNYYINISNYSFDEFFKISSIITDLWVEKILTAYNSDPDKAVYNLSLADEFIKKIILSNNPDKFNSLSDVDDFCDDYNISVSDLCIPAKYSEFEFELKALSVRLTSEIYFYRRKLLTELFISKFERKISKYSNSLHEKLFSDWKIYQISELNIYKKYINSEFTYIADGTSDCLIIQTNSVDSIIAETQYWLDNHEKSKVRFNRAIELYKNKIDNRDCLDNLRLSLELLLKDILNNNKSIENQSSDIGKYLINLGVSTELRNTFVKVIDYYVKFQNDKVKHDLSDYGTADLDIMLMQTMLIIRSLKK